MFLAVAGEVGAAVVKNFKVDDYRSSFYKKIPS